MKLSTRDRKKFRIRNKLKKVSSFDRFRLSISRSANNISAQIIDDSKNITLLSASSVTFFSFLLMQFQDQVTISIDHMKILFCSAIAILPS